MQLKLLTRQLNSRIFKMKTNQYIILLLLIASESSSEYPSSFERLHQLEILRNGKVEIPNLVDRIKSYLFDLTSNNQNGENEVLDISDECMTHLEFWGESISQPPPGQTWPIESKLKLISYNAFGNYNAKFFFQCWMHFPKFLKES